MTEKDKKDLIEMLLEDKNTLQSSIDVSETKIKYEKEHIRTINNVLNNLQEL